MDLSHGPDDITFAVIAGTVLLSVLLVFILYFIFLHQRERQRFNWERQQFHQELLQTQIEIREQTLVEMSLELHDNLGQIASLIKINLNLVSTELKEQDRSKITDSIDLLKQLITDIKSMSLSLNSERLSTIGLIEAIRGDFERVNKSGQLVASLKHTGEQLNLDNETETFLYRISQELLNNSIKHAEASKINMSLEKKQDQFFMRYNDNGKGFNLQEALIKSKSAGLSNLKHRCKIIHADLDLQSQPDKGTFVTITLPLQKIKA